MKYFVPLFAALALCGCAHKASVAPATPAAPQSIAVELANSDKEQALVCSDDLDCLKRLTGFCTNGYSGSRNLHSENGRVVGVLFHCITDEEKQEAAQEEAEEDAQRAAAVQEMQRRAEEQKKQHKK